MLELPAFDIRDGSMTKYNKTQRSLNLITELYVVLGQCVDWGKHTLSTRFQYWHGGQLHC
jgi:hypothetical protein